jgi:23S rRNA pseudouridine1911/1915/1917 synthase
VRVNGIPCIDLGHPVADGDVVRIDYDPGQGYKPKKQEWDDRNFSILYEDDDLLVVDKAAGVLTVATDRGEPNTLETRVGVYLSHAGRKRNAFIVHRLDREVSGLLVIAKSYRVAEALIEQFKQHKPERVYVAIVAGKFRDDSGTIRSHLATGKNLDRFSAPESDETELAVTHYKVLQHLRDTTLLEVRLETGRRNQIRVHLSESRHPVLGDPRYGKKFARHPHWSSKRLALHAHTLEFEHPVTNERLTCESKLPIDMERFIAHSSAEPSA